MDLYCNTEVAIIPFLFQNSHFFEKRFCAQKSSLQSLALSSQCPVDIMTWGLLSNEGEKIFPVTELHSHP